MSNYEFEVKIKNQVYKCVVKKNKSWKKIHFRYFDNCLQITAPYFSTKQSIYNTTLKMENTLYKLIYDSKKREISFENFENINFFGKEYIIVYSNKIGIEGSRMYLNKNDPKASYLKLAKEIGYDILLYRVNYYLNIIKPKLELKELKVRNMVSKYGVCFVNRKTITLNSKLAYFNIDQIDSVIIHELIHLIYPDHSRQFYNKVLEYCPNYYKLHDEMQGVSLR